MKFTTRDELRAWLDGLAQDHDLVAPRNVDGHVLYRPTTASDEILFDYERPELSVKDCLLPATEILLQVKKRGQEVEQEQVLPDHQQVIFGLRPCDAHGLASVPCRDGARTIW